MSTDFFAKIFGEGENSLKVVTVKGEHFFPAMDAGLKLHMKNPWDNLRKLQPGAVVDLDLGDTEAMIQNYLTLGGLFELISMSRKPEAVQWKTWVHYKLLPELFYAGGNTLEERSAALGEAVFGTTERTFYHGVYLNHKTRNLSYKIDGNNFPNFECSIGHLAWKQHSSLPKYFCKACHSQFGPNAYHNVWFDGAVPTVKIAA